MRIKNVVCTSPWSKEFTWAQLKARQYHMSRVVCNIASSIFFRITSTLVTGYIAEKLKFENEEWCGCECAQPEGAML